MSGLSTPHKFKLGLGSAGTLMTPAEFDSVTDYDDRYRYELVEEKRLQYLDLGVKEYWIIDRFRRTITVYRREPATTGTDTVVTITESETYRTDLLPGFELPLARLLAIADWWR
jgi:Uma2 family endonuclease